MTPMPIVDLFIRRLALPTVNCALHFALECSREVARIVFHFLNPQDGLVRSHRLQEILRETPFFFFVFLIDPTVHRLFFSDYQWSEKRPISQLSIPIFLPEALILSTTLSTRMTSLGRWVLTDMSRTTNTIPVILKFFYFFQSSISG